MTATVTATVRDEMRMEENREARVEGELSTRKNDVQLKRLHKKKRSGYGIELRRRGYMI